MTDRMRKGNKDGSALLLTVMLMALLVVLGTGLLGAARSMYRTATGRHEKEMVRELAQSLSGELEREIAIDQSAAEKEPDRYALWNYLKREIWAPGGWSYYAPELSGHGEEDAYRYFAIGSDAPEDSEAEKILGDIRVLMFWEPKRAIEVAGNGTAEQLTGIRLTVRVTAAYGESEYTEAAGYELAVHGDGTEREEQEWKWTLAED